MSIRVMDAAWRQDLADSPKLVLLALADWADDDGKCWPSIAKLMAKCSKSERTIQAALKLLDAEGYLSRYVRPGKGVTYWIHPWGCPTADKSDKRSGAYGGHRGQAKTTPADSAGVDPAAPPQNLHPTPAESAPNTSETPQRSDTDVSEPRTRALSDAQARKAGFAAFMAAYPHRVGERAALAVWNELWRGGELPATAVLLDAVALYAKSKPVGREWCNPATWLRDGRWADRPADKPRAGAVAAAPSEPLPAWAGPSEIRAAVVAAKGEAAAVSYLDSAAWVAGRIVPRTPMAHQRLTDALGGSPWLELLDHPPPRGRAPQPADRNPESRVQAS